MRSLDASFGGSHAACLLCAFFLHHLARYLPLAIPNFSFPYTQSWDFSGIPPVHPCFPRTNVLLIKLHTVNKFF